MGDIKWYFNNSPTPIYQWLPAMATGPQIIDPRFNEYLDLKYTVSGEKYLKHRALHLVNVSRHLTGDYMCKVSSFVDEDFNRKSLQIFVAPSVVKFSHESLEMEGRTRVSCSAEGIYPSPTLKIFWKDGLMDDVEKTVVSEDPDGYFSILHSTSIQQQYIRRGVELGCEISIPGTDYSIKEELLIGPDINADPRVSGASVLSASSLPIILLLLVLVNQSAFKITFRGIQSETTTSSSSQSEGAKAGRDTNIKKSKAYMQSVNANDDNSLLLRRVSPSPLL